MQSQAMLLQTKDEAMKALNAKIAELERKVNSQTKEIAAIKAKGLEEKEQLIAEARAHERAKNQM
jgi:predicted phage tail protein